MAVGEPLVLVRSRVLKGRDADDRGVAAAAADLEALLRVEVQRLGASVVDVGDVSVEDDPMGAWTRVTRTVLAHAQSGAERDTRRGRP